MPASKEDGHSDDAVSAAEAKAAIERYSSAVERRLKPGLDAACQLRDKAFEQLAETDQMEKALDVLDAAAKDSAEAKKAGTMRPDEAGRLPPALETKVNIGEEFYMNAHVYSLDPVIVDLGLGVLVEMSRSEARDYVKKRRDVYESQARNQTKRIAEVQAHLQSVMKNLSELRIASYGNELMENRVAISEED